MAVTPTYVPLATYTVAGSADASVEFTSIPATYRDLILVVGNLSATASNSLYARFNSDTGTNYSFVVAVGHTGGAQSTSSGAVNGLFFGAAFQGLATSGSSQAILQVMDYAQTDKHKTALARYGSAGRSETDMTASRWANTNAINAMTLIILGSGSYNVGTTFSLYGVH